MERPSWERVEVLLKAALDIEDARARDTFLVAQCGSDKELLAEVRRLLSESEGGNSRFLEPPSMLAFDLTGRTIDDFEIIEEIGRGGSGIVYRARQRSLDRSVALKVLPLVLRANEATAERFRREAIAASKLRHPGIASVISFGEVDGTFFYAMEFVDGPSLRDVMDRAWTDRALPIDSNVSHPRAIARLVAEVADALHFAHEGHVVHRDVKPHNILLERDGRPRLIDFGLAKLIDRRSISLRGDLLGTMYYMSPEQTRARQEDVDRRSDVFSLGIVMYELLARRRPFDGASHVSIFKSITEDDAPSMRRAPLPVPRDLETICRHALEKEPKDRYQTAREFAEDLRRYLNGEPIVAKPLPAGVKIARTVVKRRTLLVAVPVAIAAGAAAVYATQPKGPTFVQRVRTLDGSKARLFSREVLSVHGDRLGPVRDHGVDRTWDLDLTAGIHRIELVADDGRFAQGTAVELSEEERRDLVLDLHRPYESGAVPSGWVLVPGGTQSVELFEGVVDGLPRYSAQLVDVAPFLVETICVSVATTRALRAAHPFIRSGIGVVALAKYESETRVGVVDSHPFVGATFGEAQQLAGIGGGRIPTVAESLLFAAVDDPWWRTSARAVPPEIVVGREVPARLRDSISYAEFAQGSESVASRPVVGPHRLHHALGNVAVWSSSCMFNGDGRPDPVRWISSGAHWSSALEDLESRPFALLGLQPHRGGHWAVGLRRVRSLAPELG